MRIQRLALVVVALTGSVAAADPPDPSAPNDTLSETAASDEDHADPRVKLSYRRFAIAGLDGSPLILDGAQLDLYGISERWMRLGIEFEGGVGHPSIEQVPASVGYGLVGATVGLQYPARITPFVEGRVMGGILGGSFDNNVVVANLGNSAATWIWGAGIDLGIELYTIGRGYLSASIGWVRTTWHGVDLPAMEQSPTTGMIPKNLTADSFTFKLGIGL
jgi:hypothetical protein